MGYPRPPQPLVPFRECARLLVDTPVTDTQKRTLT